MELAASLEAFDQAITVADTYALGELRSLVRVSRSGSRMYAGDLVAALEDLDEADVLGHGHSRAAVRHQRAVVLTMLGRYEDGVRDATASLRSFRQRKDTLWEARSLLNRSNMHLLAGRPDRGIRDARNAQSLFESIGHQSGAAKSLENLGNLLALAGRLLPALQIFREADARFNELGLPLALAAEGRLTALLHAGLADDALEMALAVRDDVSARSAGGALAEVHLGIARCALRIGDLATADQSASDARELFVAQGRTSWAAMAELVSASVVDDLSIDDALRIGSQLDALGWRASAQEAWLLGGNSARRCGDAAGAERCLLPALRHARTPTIATRIGVLRAKTLLQMVQGRSRSALATAEQALRMADANRRALHATELRLAAGTSIDDVARLGIEISLLLADDRAIWRWVEGTRHASALGMRSEVDSPSSDVVTQLRATAARIDESVFAGNAPPAELVAKQALLERNVQDLDRLTAGADTLQQARATSRRQLSARLGSRVFVHFFESQGRLLALRTDSAGSNVHNMCASDMMRRQVIGIRSALLRTIASPNDDRFRVAALAKLCAEADAAIIAPLEAGNDVVISPCGRLFGLPWSMLPTLQSASVSVVTSANAWARASLAQSKQTSGRVQRVACLAGPGLEHASDEVARVASAWRAGHRSGERSGARSPDPVHLVGPAATVEAATLAFRTSDIVHISCHATLRVDSPAFSALHLADGPLMLRDLQALDSVPRIVVLSACSGAQGVERAGGQILGLGTVLLGQGVETVIAPVLPVADAVLPELMAAMHTALATGVAAGPALARAFNDAEVIGVPRQIASIRSFVTLGVAS